MLVLSSSFNRVGFSAVAVVHGCRWSWMGAFLAFLVCLGPFFGAGGLASPRYPRTQRCAQCMIGRSHSFALTTECRWLLESLSISEETGSPSELMGTHLLKGEGEYMLKNMYLSTDCLYGLPDAAQSFQVAKILYSKIPRIYRLICGVQGL